MPSVKTPNLAKTERLEPVAAICHEIRNHLERRRDQVCQEITNHPTPIPACDVHFNRLLEERAKIFQELGRLDKLQENVEARGQDFALLGDFIRTSEAIGGADRSRLGTALKNVLAAGRP